MKKTKIIVIILAAVLILGLLAGGIYLLRKNANRISDTEAKEILSELIPKAQKINDIVWGKGLPVLDSAPPELNSIKGAQYRAVDSSCGFANTDDLKKAIAEVYSQRYIETAINYTAFEGTGAEDGELYATYPRYKDNNDGLLCIDIENPGFELTTEISTDAVKVKSADFEKITIETNAKVGGVTVPLELVLVKEDNGWRLDTPTY